jgi:hypothetical protein
MERERLKLPAGFQNFEELRKGCYVYVDKTKYLVNLIDTGKIYFLARPRRFGKTLTVSTFEALFSGKKALFQGLYAEEFLNRPDFQPSPVIRLDMSEITTNEGMDGVKESICSLTKFAAKKLNVKLSDTDLYGDLLGELIVETAEKYGQKVVFLLDEYDKPYTDFVNDPIMAEKVRNVLRSFYARIKTRDEYLRFVFITGISKFAKFGVFSTLNHLTDISLMPEYAEICGYTEEEILHYFPEYLADTAAYMNISTDELIEKMRYYYNGFCFDYQAKARLYNPFSTLSFFKKRVFINHWINTGSSKFMADYMKNNHVTVEQFRNFPVSWDFAESPGDVDTTPPEGFLYQSGYLTLRPGGGESLVLDYPNTEVYNSMSKLVAQNIFEVSGNDYGSYNRRMLAALQTGNDGLLVDAINVLLASIPYDDFSKAAEENVLIQGFRFPAQEWLFRSVILSFLRGCDVVVDAELHTHLGRPDLVIAHCGQTWIVEIKVAYQGQTAEKKAEEALKQIIDNQYAKPYPGAICLGLGIDDADRQIMAWKTTDFCPRINTNF